MFLDPKANIIKKWLSQLINNRSMMYMDLCDRISLILATQKDLELFGGLLMTLHEVGYRKAIKDIQKQLEDQGINIKLNVENKME